jgi:hypothetical protein
MPTATIETDTPRNPANEGSYKLESVPAAESGSRYAKRTNFEGHSVQPAEAVAQAWAELARARMAQAPELAPEPKTVPLLFITRNQASEVVRQTRGKVSRTPELEVSRSGRFNKSPAEVGGQLLDRLFLEPNLDVRDEAIWDALEAAIEELNVKGGTLRALNDAVAVLICARAGLRVNARDLPSPGAK